MMIVLTTRMRMLTRQLIADSVKHRDKGAMIEEFKTCRKKSRLLLLCICMAIGYILCAQMVGSGCSKSGSASELNNNNNVNIVQHGGGGFRRLLEVMLTNDSDFEMNARTGSAIVIFLIMSALANSAGIGGGLFWVPLFSSLLQFTVKSAAALSQSCVATGTLGGSLLSITQRSPVDRDRPMIDYSLTLVLMPALILGMSIGVLLNIMLPSLIISSILLVVLLLISFRTLQNGFRMRKAEKIARARMDSEVVISGQDLVQEDDTADVENGDQKEKETKDVMAVRLEAGVVAGTAMSESPASDSNGDSRPYERHSLDEKTSLDGTASCECTNESNETSSNECAQPEMGMMRKASSVVTQVVVASFKDAQSPVIPWKYAAEILSIAVAFLGLEIGKSFFSRCSWEFYTMLGAQVILMVGCSSAFIWFHDHPAPIQAHHHRAQHDIPNEQQHGEDDTDEQNAWKPWRLALFWVVMLVLGVLAGTIGLGGGVLISPVLLELHVHPQTAAATSTFITFFASTVATVAFGLDDRLNLQYMAVYAPICLVGGFFGVYVLSGLIKKYNITSIVSILMGILVLLSAGLVIGFALRESIQDLVNGQPLTVESLCNS